MSYVEVLHLAPLLIVLGGGIVLMLLGAKEGLSIRHCSYVALGCLGVALVFQGMLVGQLYTVPLLPELLGGMLIADSYAGYFNVILLVAAIVIVLTAQHYFIIHRYYKGEFFALFLFSVFGMLLLTQARELMVAFIALEIASISVYVMIGYHKSHDKRVEAAYKYLVLGSLAGALFLLGVGCIYAGAQTTRFGELLHVVATRPLEELLRVRIGATFLLITFLFKIAAFPFQGWAIDVYDGAPLPITGFMAAAFKIAVFGFMLRLMLVEFEAIKEMWNMLLVGVIVCTLVYGSLMAIVQQSIKRMLAASSIVHTGYLLIAFLSTDALPGHAASSIIFYQVAYFLSAVGAFGLLSYILSDDRLRITYEDFKGFALLHPYMAASMSVFMLSLAGIPSTIGFIGKFYIFTGAIQAGYTPLAVFAMVATGVSVYYYFKLIAMMYFYPSATLTTVPVFRGITPKVIGALAVGVIVGGVGGVDIIMDLATLAYDALMLG